MVSKVYVARVRGDFCSSFPTGVVCGVVVGGVVVVLIVVIVLIIVSLSVVVGIVDLVRIAIAGVAVVRSFLSCDLSCVFHSHNRGTTPFESLASRAVNTRSDAPSSQ